MSHLTPSTTKRCYHTVGVHAIYVTMYSTVQRRYHVTGVSLKIRAALSFHMCHGQQRNVVTVPYVSLPIAEHGKNGKNDVTMRITSPVRESYSHASCITTNKRHSYYQEQNAVTEGNAPSDDRCRATGVATNNMTLYIYHNSRMPLAGVSMPKLKTPLPCHLLACRQWSIIHCFAIWVNIYQMRRCENRNSISMLWYPSKERHCVLVKRQPRFTS